MDGTNTLIGSIEKALAELVGSGMVPPLVFAAVSQDGDFLVIRCQEGADGNLRYQPIAMRSEAPGACIPINGMVVDQSGRAAHLVIGSDATTVH